jgi:adenylate cyclase
MGSATSKTFTVMGDTVNLASRLEGANKIYGTKIIVMAETVALAKNEIAFRELDLITVAGKTEPVRIYEVLGTKDALDQRDAELHDAFARGLEAYRAQDWALAGRQFQLCLDLNPKDGPSRAFAARTARFRQESPPTGWNGVWRLAEK